MLSILPRRARLALPSFSNVICLASAGSRGGGSFWASAASSHSGTRNTSSAFTLGSAPGY
ncbi:Uncharacterised protein [Mycobacteroides abscessus subsp. abscessus]|nr:Uncharacterised protein [Mycobacteroides abscessus subsp. abscessus]